jgi:hypothetical protein
LAATSTSRPRLAIVLPVSAGFHGHDFGGPGLHRGAELAEQVPPLPDRGFRPGRLGRLGCQHRLVHVLGGADGNAAVDLFSARIDGLDPLVAVAGHEVPADVHQTIAKSARHAQ